jgi:hypothetical protein
MEVNIMEPTQQEIIAKIREILKGIDTTELEDINGWWETSAGAEFGSRKLAELEELVASVKEIT